MPRAAPAPCTYPGCPALVTPGTGGRCAQHKPDDRQWKATADYRARARIYRSPRWRSLRRTVLHATPLCATPDCADLAEDLDHVRPLREILEHGLDPFDPANVQPLCHACHSRKTAAEVFGRR
jgi:5-methylcytosine-specific restriction enzyme A